MKRSKAYQAAAEKIDSENLYAPIEAARLVKETSVTKFDSSVEVSMRLGVDPRKADQLVRGTVNLPHGTGKTARVLVFANGLCNVHGDGSRFGVGHEATGSKYLAECSHFAHEVRGAHC